MTRLIATLSLAADNRRAGGGAAGLRGEEKSRGETGLHGGRALHRPVQHREMVQRPGLHHLRKDDADARLLLRGQPLLPAEMLSVLTGLRRRKSGETRNAADRLVA